MQGLGALPDPHAPEGGEAFGRQTVALQDFPVRLTADPLGLEKLHNLIGQETVRIACDRTLGQQFVRRLHDIAECRRRKLRFGNLTADHEIGRFGNAAR